jgi:hypothetical protein
VKVTEKITKGNNVLQAIQLTQLEPAFLKNYREPDFLRTLNRTVAPGVDSLIGAAKALSNVESFPHLVKRHFQSRDLNRLRFGPDVTIRPGTTFDNSGPLFGDESPMPAEGLDLKISALLDAIPFGAPARIKLRVSNKSGEPQRIPISFSLKTGIISGSVVDPGGNEHTFWPLKKWEDSDPGGILGPYQSRTYTMTLLRGAQKALFPMVGSHLVKVRANWECNGISLFLGGQTTVHVTAPVDHHHLAAALKILSTPDTLFSVAIIGDHLIEGNEAIESSMSNPVLRGHFAIIRAKLLLTGPHDPKPNEACELITDNVVMSFDEIDKVGQLLTKRYQPGAGLDPDKLNAAIACLKRKINKLRAEGSIEREPAEMTTKRLEALVKAYL